MIRLFSATMGAMFALVAACDSTERDYGSRSSGGSGASAGSGAPGGDSAGGDSSGGSAGSASGTDGGAGSSSTLEISGTLHDAWVGETYSATLDASGGSEYTWRLLGDAPPGLELGADGAQATLSGVPTTRGSYELTFEVSSGDDSVQYVRTLLVRQHTPLVYVADEEVVGQFRLHYVDVAVDGGMSTEIDLPLAATEQVQGFSWSPNGRYLAVRTDRSTPDAGRVLLVDFSGFSLSVSDLTAELPPTEDSVVNVPQPFWRPDSSVVAFRYGDSDLYAVPIDDGVPGTAVNLSQDIPGSYQGILWSPNLEFALLRGSDATYLLVGDQAAEPINLGVAGPQLTIEFSADSRRLAQRETGLSFNCYAADLTTLPPSFVQMNQAISDTAPLFYGVQWALSPDSKYFAYVNYENPAPNDERVYLLDYSANVPGTRRMLALSSGGPLTWAPDAQMLYYRQGSGTIAGRGVDNDQLSFSYSPGAFWTRPRWSPAGDWMIISVATASGEEVRAHAYAGEPQDPPRTLAVLEEGSGIDTSVAFAPGGRFVLFGTGTSASGARTIYLSDLRSAGVVVTEAGLDQTWSPQGDRFAFRAETAAMTGELWLVDATVAPLEPRKVSGAGAVLMAAFPPQ